MLIATTLTYILMPTAGYIDVETLTCSPQARGHRVRVLWSEWRGRQVGLPEFDENFSLFWCFKQGNILLQLEVLLHIHASLGSCTKNLLVYSLRERLRRHGEENRILYFQ